MTRKQIESWSRFVVGLFACVIYIIPLFWMVSTSLKPVEQIFQKPPVLFPSTPQLESYRSILGLPTDRPDLYINTVVYFKNSLIIASWTTILVFLLAVPSAYALSRFKFRGRSAFLLFLLVAQMLPSVLLVIPLFVLFKRLGLYSTYLVSFWRTRPWPCPLPLLFCGPAFCKFRKPWKKPPGSMAVRACRYCGSSSFPWSEPAWWP